MFVDKETSLPNYKKLKNTHKICCSKVFPRFAITTPGIVSLGGIPHSNLVRFTSFDRYHDL